MDTSTSSARPTAANPPYVESPAQTTYDPAIYYEARSKVMGYALHATNYWAARRGDDAILGAVPRDIADLLDGLAGAVAAYRDAAPGQ